MRIETAPAHQTPIERIRMTVGQQELQPRRDRRVVDYMLAAPLLLVFLTVGLVGTYRYVDNFWLYRGFAPPRDPAFVHVHGVQETISVVSPALGGRSQQVIVYLPPGYDTSGARRYPVMYLLHGFPGRPLAFLETVRMGMWVDTLVAQKRIGGAILVMPFGSTGTFEDKEWANGIRRDQGWETFVAHDVVQAIDARYRTVRSSAGRTIAGLSEGGYGAINIALHHPLEFGVIESWSGYMRADNIPSIFGSRAALLAYNSPARYLPHVAAQLRKNGTYIWFYTGSRDSLLAQNRAFAAELARYRIPHRFFVDAGGHTWRIWRANARAALLVAVARSGA
jgi:enterochelin esterase-like enzyme